jgi:hypothetical protein
MSLSSCFISLIVGTFGASSKIEDNAKIDDNFQPNGSAEEKKSPHERYIK